MTNHARADGPATGPSRRSYLKGLGTAGAAGLTGAAGCLGGGGEGGPVTVAYMPIYPDMQYFVMQEEGYFDEIDREVEGKQFPSGPAIVKAFASGDIDVAMFGIVPAMIVIDRGIPAEVVAANVVEPMAIMAHEDFHPLWEQNDPKAAFEQWRADTGSTFSFGTFPEGSVPDILLRYWLIDEHGLEPGTAAEVLGLGGASAVFQGLANGEIDGTSIMEPVPTRVEAEGLPYSPLALAGEFMPGQPAAVTLMKDEVRNTAFAEQFVEQHVRATAFTNANPDAAAEHASAVIGEQNLPVSIAKRAMASPLSNFISNPHEIRSGTKVFAEYAKRLGKTDQRLTMDQVFDYDPYDAVTGN
ncbi:ABC transporter substrate-binding protein [Halobaculum gomorrense]|uniref:NitT/TauT family transport system substrate-binding protein n=1 Tax=Halobaculum gomorrense TaxID=43928 RepID=A0A1M5RIJ7_9EURY|nr:ABC transporter substrate-binding protein [Halobaculum gomorrense]SHH25889.1 NitT/TauT family transport system substrate-binding protein [Halobaculum gomorrense]